MNWWNSFWNEFKYRYGLTGNRQNYNNTGELVRGSGYEFFELNGQVVWESVEGSKEAYLAYLKCAPLSSIISDKAKAFSNAKIEIVNETDEEIVTDDNSSWVNLLKKPNPHQNKQQFMRQLFTYTNANGWCFVMKEIPTGFNGSPEDWELYVLPYWMVYIDESKTFTNPNSREEILNNAYFEYFGNRTKLDPDSLILITDTTGALHEKTLLPKSRTCLNGYPISTQLSASEAEVTMIQNKGAVGILSDQGANNTAKVPLNEQEKTDVELAFSHYGLTRSQKQVIITNANLNWQPMNFPVKDLMLHESDIKAVKALCNAFDFPYELTPYSDRKNLANVNSFLVALYANTIIPEAQDYAEQLSRGLGMEEEGLRILYTYDHVKVLQKSEEEKARALREQALAYQEMFSLGIVTRNDILEKLGEERLSDPRFDLYSFEDISNEESEEESNNEEETEEEA